MSFEDIQVARRRKDEAITRTTKRKRTNDMEAEAGQASGIAVAEDWERFASVIEF